MLSSIASVCVNMKAPRMKDVRRRKALSELLIRAVIVLRLVLTKTVIAPAKPMH
jgi:hypothetical protein